MHRSHEIWHALHLWHCTREEYEPYGSEHVQPGGYSNAIKLVLLLTNLVASASALAASVHDTAHYAPSARCMQNDNAPL